MTSPHARMKTEALQTLSAIMSLPIQLCFLFIIYLLCKVDGDVKLQQKSLSTKSVGKTVVLDCNFPSDCREFIHWYQLKEGQPLRRILYSSIASGATNNDAGFESFKIDKKQSNMALKIPELKDEHSAVYYCACWVSGGTVVININTLYKNPAGFLLNSETTRLYRDILQHEATTYALLHKLPLFVQEQMTVVYKKVFGSGTRLYVTAQGKDKFNLPTLYGYLPSKKDKNKNDKHGKQTMLCQASGMFPDLVTFKWEKKDAGNWKDISEGDVVEQRNESPTVTVTSMLIVDKDKAQTDNYQCTVIHEGNSEKPKPLEMKKENSEPVKESNDDDQNPVTCPPSTEEPITKQISGDSEQIPSMFLFVYAYDVLLMKNGLFFCVVSIFLLKRKAGRKDKSSET